MYVVRIADPERFRVCGPFYSLFEAREYLVDTEGAYQGHQVIEVEQPDPAGLVEPGL